MTDKREEKVKDLQWSGSPCQIKAVYWFCASSLLFGSSYAFFVREFGNSIKFGLGAGSVVYVFTWWNCMQKYQSERKIAAMLINAQQNKPTETNVDEYGSTIGSQRKSANTAITSLTNDKNFQQKMEKYEKDVEAKDIPKPHNAQ